MFTTNSKSLETTPYSLSVTLVKFEDHRSDASHKMTQSVKNGAYFDHLEPLSEIIVSYPVVARPQ